VDVAQRRSEVAHSVRAHGPTALKLLGCLVLATLAGWGAVTVRQWALTSPTFTLQQLSVEGTVRATPAELMRLGGLAPGQNLFALDVDVLARALATHPWVRRADATRHFPAGLSLRVEEYEPAALLAMGDLYVLDGEGVPFKRLQPGDGVDLPLVTGLEREAWTEDADGAAARVREALAVVRAYEEAGLGKGGTLSEVRLEADGVVLVAGEGQEVRLPRGDVTTHLRRLGLVRAELARRGVGAEVIHLDNRARPGWIAVRVPVPASERSGAPVRQEAARSRE
jgi:cell division protein FtsQ